MNNKSKNKTKDRTIRGWGLVFNCWLVPALRRSARKIQQMKTKEEEIFVELRMIKNLLIVIALVLTLIAGILNVEVLVIGIAVVLAVSLLVLFILRKSSNREFRDWME